MRRKTNPTDRRQISTTRSRKMHQAKFHALLQAGYTELGMAAGHLGRKFAHSDAESLKYLDWPEAG